MEPFLSRTGCLCIPIKLFQDSRGFFTELYKKSAYPSLPEFTQDNVSGSKCQVVRGLHFQAEHPQGKLVRVLSGTALDVVVDLRVGSPTFGQTETFLLEPNGFAVYVPPAFGHGFWALSDIVFHYKCTEEYHAASDGGINPLDPSLNLPWKDQSGLIISDKDLRLPKLADLKLPFRYHNA